MRVYNYLFYMSYLFTKRSGNFDDVPVLGGMLFVIPCLMFNIFTVFILLEAWGVNTVVQFKKENKYIFTFSLLLILLFYYFYKGRYKRIIDKFEQKKKRILLPPILVIIIYYAISFGLLLLAGLYKNHDWVFASKNL